MGFFDFLRKKEPESIKFSEVDGWLDKLVEDKKLGQRISKVKRIIIEKVDEGYKFLEELETAGLKNENIPERAKHVMEGHRKIYINRLKRFLDNIDVPDDFSQIGHYIARFSESIDELSKETQKNYLVLKEFMEAELSRVIKTVKRIEDDLSKLQASIEKEGLETIKDAKMRVKQHQDDLKKKSRLEEERAVKENDLEALREKKVKFENKVKELKKSKDYEAYKDFLDKKQKYEEQLKSIEQELKEVFAELSRPLKKYKHGSFHENIIDKYLLDPVGTLEIDDSLIIKDVFNKMKQQLDTLELKEKQLEKTVEMLGKVGKDFLTTRKLEIGRLKGLNKEAAVKINRSVVALNISENETWLKAMEEKIVNAEKLIEELKRETADINPDYLKQKVKEKVKEIANVIIEDD